MPSTNNYIEDFFISIGFDTKKVKKEAREIDKILDGLTKRRSNAEKKAHDNSMKQEGLKRQAKIKTAKIEQETAQKAFLERVRIYKAEKAAIRKLEAEKQAARAKTEAQRRKQAISSLTGGSGAGKAKASASVFQQAFAQQDAIAKAEKIKTDAQHARQIKRVRERAKLRRDRLAEEVKANTIAKRGLQERLRLYKTRKAKLKVDEDLSKRSQLMGSSLKYDRSYMKLKSAGRLGDFDERIKSAVGRNDIDQLRLLKKEMQATAVATRGLQRQMVGLTTVQRGLSDSTRNMIRSYASVFALFQGTVAIKKVGMEFESLRASLLTVSDSEADAAEKMSFIRNEAVRLGIDLKAASRAYLGLAASAGDALGEGGVRRLFTSVLGISKAFGMSVDDTKGTFKAFTQMLSKG